MSALAGQVTTRLHLDSRGDVAEQLLDLEDAVYKASPVELQSIRNLVHAKQAKSGFDDEGPVARFVSACAPRAEDGGGGGVRWNRG